MGNVSIYCSIQEERPVYYTTYPISELLDSTSIIFYLVHTYTVQLDNFIAIMDCSEIITDEICIPLQRSVKYGCLSEDWANLDTPPK